MQAEKRARVEELLEGLSWLLSFATSSEVAWYRWEHNDSSPGGRDRSIVARAGYFRSLFDINNGKVIRSYLECVQKEYFRLQGIRKLPAAINLFTIAETRSLPMELKLTTISILLENLKSTFAVEQGYPFKDGYYRKASGKAWTFVGLLSDMLGQVGMASSDLSAIKKLRDEIIHSGISQTPYNHQRKIYDKCQDLIREYLLRLLGYKVYFRLYSGRGMTPKPV